MDLGGAAFAENWDGDVVDRRLPVFVVVVAELEGWRFDCFGLALGGYCCLVAGDDAVVWSGVVVAAVGLLWTEAAGAQPGEAGGFARQALRFCCRCGRLWWRLPAAAHNPHLKTHPEPETACSYQEH